MIAFIRSGERPADSILGVCNFTPVPGLNYRVGVPRGGRWREILNSDAQPYGGVPEHGCYHALSLILPPLGVLFLKSG